ncbi:response regulator transcription factor [Desulforamulus aquiferis]|uniref:Stage 0 sporulation protein A homolog n=1 Tax=Desulforamulus aquiferis TaxID=1397668 RepID=A0AAW7Z935_9FIRM|nr:response regulator transcription factor [Desulforamulus aquiferis]MDO7785892.1 response regulator transcription factor [Desulforamulus aquiferis]RYD02144.1 PhoB family transcriptional regulator [Desulforamulus aquiferis]
MNKTILIVEDEPRMQDIIADYLQNEGYQTLVANNGVEALELFKKNRVDLILLDVMMPKLDGLSVCRNIRKYNSQVLIIMLTAKSEENDKLLGYEYGADDYVTKPFSLKILVAKINALLKRAGDYLKESPEIHYVGRLVVNELSHTVALANENIELTPKEFELLVYFIRNKNMVLSREIIMNKVWGYEYYGDLRTVDTHVKRLRQKLKSESDIISTVRGIGYKLEVIK